MLVISGFLGASIPINFSQDASLTVVEGEEEGAGKYGYYYLPFSAHFTEINDHYCRILGYNQDKGAMPADHTVGEKEDDPSYGAEGF
ncbi:MAG: hypothetical protein U0T56_12665 [Ferruginibacter sp.]